MSAPRIPFQDLHLTEDAESIRAAIARVMASGRYILGPEVAAFEEEFAAASGARYAIGTANGTDAIALVLRALGIGPGDEVITTPLSAAYTALAVTMVGARPVFADVDEERLTLDPAAAERAVTSRTRALLPVHLYGQPAEMQPLVALAARHRLMVVEDCCQAHFATCNGRPVGTFGEAGAFSFYPTKNLGALGDGGAIVTNDPTLAERLRQLRNGGQSDRYRHRLLGVNSRLDEMQAAILRARLPNVKRHIDKRRELASVYRRTLATSHVRVPAELDSGHVYHLFPIRTPKRSTLQSHLMSAGIETLVHYPVAISRQPAFGGLDPALCPIAERVVEEVLSLPLHERLTVSDVTRVASAVLALPNGEGKELAS
jgi:dTDP-3-amino-3,4,6-trideoxy-alpha-D-glucose transaminase